MAITRRVTKTVTEHFDDNLDSQSTMSGSIMGSQSTPSLQDIKADNTRTSSQEEEPAGIPLQPESSALSGDASRFGLDFSAWIGAHSIKLFSTIAVAFIPIVTTIWWGASQFGKISHQVEVLNRDMKETKDDVKSTSERLRLIEINRATPKINQIPEK